MSQIEEIAVMLEEIAAELKAAEQPKTVAICCDTIKRLTTENGKLKAELAGVKATSQRAIDAMATSADHWRNRALSGESFQADALRSVIVELRKEVKRLRAKVDEGWITWAGGECPIKDRRTVVDVKFRNGDTLAAQPPHMWRWGHGDGDGDEWMDIVAYRIATVPNE